jgi:hypothetical protein
MSQPPKILLDQLRYQIQLKHYSPCTEETYTDWVPEFIPIHKAKSGTFHHPGEMGISVFVNRN